MVDSKIVIGADVSAVSAGFAKADREAAKLTGSLGRVAREGFGDLDRSARDSVSSVVDSLGMLGGVASRLAGIAGGLAAGGALFTWLKTGADQLAAFQDAADATGATVDKLGALEEIARRNGGNLDLVTSAIVKLNDQLKDTNPDSAAARVLRSIGLEAEELRRLDPAEALQRVAVAFSAYAEDGNKARSMQELLGRGVRELAPLLNDLAEAGDLSGRSIASSVEEADRFNKTLAQLNGNVSALGRSLVSELLPSINEAFDSWRKLDELFNGFGNTPWLRAGVRTGGGLLSGGDMLRGAEKTREVIAELEADLSKLERASTGRFALDTSREQSRLRARLEDERKLLGFFQQRLALTENLASYSNEGRGATRRLPAAEPAPPRSAERAAAAAVKPQFVGVPDRELASERRRRADEAQQIMDRLEQERERRLQESARLGEQLVAQTQEINASLIQEDRARGLAQIEIDRQTVAARISALAAAGVDVSEAQEALNVNVIARQRLLEEQLKPNWRRLLESWQDTTSSMSRSYDELMDGVVARSEDVLTRFVRTGKLSVRDLADYVEETIARMVAQKAVAKLFELADVVFGGGLGGSLAKGGSRRRWRDHGFRRRRHRQ